MKNNDKKKEPAQDLVYSDPLKALGSYGNFQENLIEKDSSQGDEVKEPDYMEVKELFSYENFARMHREIEQLKDALRELRSQTIPQILRENSELKEMVIA